MTAAVDVLIPTYRRPAALAVTLTGLAAQDLRDLRIVVSDQTDDGDPLDSGEVQAVRNYLRARGIALEVHKHLPRRGMAEHRQFLLDQAQAPFALFLDDDVILEPDVVGRMVRAIREEGCGFVGCAVIGPGFLDDERPHEQAIEFWDGPVRPEEIRPGTPQWERYGLHNAANLYHVQRRLGLTGASQRKYKVAWVGGCVLYDVAKLRELGGFAFWRDLPPEHCGEEVVAQLRLMARHGGCGLIPSGAYHQELPTTIADRRVDAPQVLRGRESARPRVSVLMPTFEQAAFVPRALDSLRAQTLAEWELIVVDDASKDGTRDAIAPFLADTRIRYYLNGRNRGLGVALNQALARARADYVAYLPSDDVYHADHLATLIAVLDAHPAAVLAYAGVRHHYNRSAPGPIDGHSLQLVQVMHRRTDDRWLEREELVTDDLDRMFWSKLRPRGGFVGTGRVSCEWVDHPHQGHKVIREPVGGINTYRVRYGVRHPLRFHTTVGNRIDEVEHYRRFRERPATPPAADGLKILLVGELAYNPERVLALEERGHKLYGLWMDEPYWYNAVGPMPFGHVTDVPRRGWREAVRRIKPDVIYALLNWQAVPFAHRVLAENPGVPFVWHFKEGPFICLEKGTWSQLIDLTTRSDGQIYSSPEMRDWF
ncbi:MAG TPA: glycosyltransferase family 2 protein, partial [Isosphaeraceae bacterium]